MNINKDYDFISLQFDENSLDHLPFSKKIETQKSMNKIKSTVRKHAKPQKCHYCGKNFSSFCNSHSIPAFCLKNIASNGEVSYSNKFLNIPFLDKEGGVGEAGTFRLLCRECDSRIFSEYENPERYQDAPTQLMLTEILMKNYLKIIYKRRIEHQQWTEMYKMFPELKDDCDYHLRGINLDLNEYYKEYQSAKAAYNKKTEKANRLIFYKKLPYNIPIAFQLGLALLYDMEGNIINDIYNTTPHSHLKQIHICAFPLVEYSVVFMFVDTKTKRYNNFCRQFLNFSFDVQLSIINYIIFLYSEDFYMHPLISHDLSKNKNFNKVVGQLTTAVPSYLGCPNKIKPILAGKDAFDLNKWNSIPNLFSECYKTNF